MPRFPACQSPSDSDCRALESKKPNTHGLTPNPASTSTPARSVSCESRLVSRDPGMYDAPSANALRESLLIPRHCLVRAAHSPSPQTHHPAPSAIAESRFAPSRPPRCGTPRATLSRPKAGERALSTTEAPATFSEFCFAVPDRAPACPLRAWRSSLAAWPAFRFLGFA